MRPVVIVQHEESVPAGSIADVLEERGIAFRTHRAWSGDSFPRVEEASAVIVMGGTMNVDELDRFPFLQRSRALMSDAIERGVPTLGVCLGSQMMARVLGAEVTRADHRNATFSGLKLTDAGRNDPLVAPFDGGVPVLQFHEDTFRVPEDAVALATSDSSGLPQAFRYGDNAYAIQFHFEVDRPILQRWMDDIGPVRMRDEWGASPDELVEVSERCLPAQDAAGRKMVGRFLDLIEP